MEIDWHCHQHKDNVMNNVLYTCRTKLPPLDLSCRLVSCTRVHERRNIYKPAPDTAKAPFPQGCDLRATFGWPENDQDARWSPKPVLPLCNRCSTILVRSLDHQNCCSGTTGLLWSSNRGTVVATAIVQGTINRPKEEQWRQKHRSNWYTVFTTARNFMGDQWSTPMHPFCDHGDVRAFLCLLWATCEWPTSSATFVRLFWTCPKFHGEHGVHGEVWTSCGATLERPRQTFGIVCAPSSDLASFVVAQGRHKDRSPCVKGA